MNPQKHFGPKSADFFSGTFRSNEDCGQIFHRKTLKGSQLKAWIFCLLPVSNLNVKINAYLPVLSSKSYRCVFCGTLGYTTYPV